MNNNSTLDRLKQLQENVIFSLSLGGASMREIQTEQLYKTLHSDFGTYVKETFGKSRSWAYTIIEDANLLEKFKAEYPNIELNPYHARVIDKYEPELRPALMQRLSEMDTITGTKIITEAEKLRPDVVQMLNAMPVEPAVAEFAALNSTLDELKITHAIELTDGNQESINVIKAVGVNLTEKAIERHHRYNQNRIGGLKLKSPEEQIQSHANWLVKLLTEQELTSVNIDENTMIVLLSGAEMSKFCTKSAAESQAKNVQKPLKSARKKALVSRGRGRVLVNKLRSQVKNKDLKDLKIDSTGKEPVLSSAKAEREIHAHTHIPAQGMRIFPFTANDKTLPKPKPVTSAKPDQQEVPAAATPHHLHVIGHIPPVLEPIAAKKTAKKRSTKQPKPDTAKKPNERGKTPKALQQAIYDCLFAAGDGDMKHASFGRAVIIAQKLWHVAKPDTTEMLIADIELFPKWYSGKSKCHIPQGTHTFMTNFAEMRTERKQGKQATSVVRSMETDPLALRPSD